MYKYITPLKACFLSRPVFLDFNHDCIRPCMYSGNVTLNRHEATSSQSSDTSVRRISLFFEGRTGQVYCTVFLSLFHISAVGFISDLHDGQLCFRYRPAGKAILEPEENHESRSGVVRTGSFNRDKAILHREKLRSAECAYIDGC